MRRATAIRIYASFRFPYNFRIIRIGVRESHSWLTIIQARTYLHAALASIPVPKCTGKTHRQGGFMNIDRLFRGLWRLV